MRDLFIVLSGFNRSGNVEVVARVVGVDQYQVTVIATLVAGTSVNDLASPSALGFDVGVAGIEGGVESLGVHVDTCAFVGKHLNGVNDVSDGYEQPLVTGSFLIQCLKPDSCNGTIMTGLDACEDGLLHAGMTHPST